jgi:hypothetical protein
MASLSAYLFVDLKRYKNKPQEKLARAGLGGTCP